jgi:uncharacterized surface protein with fasciclin (FAS1) repeats
MKLSKYFLYIVLISISIISCKEDTKESTLKSENELVLEEVTPAEQVNDNMKDKMVNSVVSKMMFTEESKSFVRYLISADLVDHLSEEEGPFTILAPSNEAFEALTEVQLSSLHNYREKEFLASVLKSHVISGNLDSAFLVQEIKKNSGKLTLTTLSGAELNFSRKGSEIIVTDQNGTKAKIGKSDIIASNGIVHLLDAVLVIN